MRRLFLSFAAMVALASTLLTGCSQATPPTPTQAPPTTSKAAEPAKASAPASAPTAAPTAAAAAAPTSVPAKKVDFPEKGKTLSLIIGYAAGGGADIAARILAVGLEKELGAPVQVVNRAGAGSQVAISSVQTAKPDGYTIGYANFPNMITIYQDPERKATFTRKDFLPIAMHVTDPMAYAVNADSPIKNVQDLVNAAKGNPEKIKVGHSGILSNEHLGYLQLQKATGVKLGIVAFDGAAPEIAALLGGHIDVAGGGFSSFLSQAKSGNARIIATFANEGKQFGVDVNTMDEQGFKGYFALSRGWFVPAGTPKEVVDSLNAAFKKTMNSEEQKAKILDIGQVTQYMDPAQFSSYWEGMEASIQPLMELAKEK